MPQKSEFVEYLIEMLQPLGTIREKSMFGGWGFYADERFFAIVADDAFYVKVDDVSRAEFESCGLKPFRYEVRGTTRASMDYYELPPEAMDDREILCDWARKGIEAAVRAAEKKTAKAKKPRKKK
jgi:DNA transformation protein